MMKATYSSNYVEILAEKLKENLLIDQTDSDSYIFIPNKIVKNYLMKKFCDDANYEIAFNMKFVNINNFLNFLSEKLELLPEKFLNNIELSFLIREKIINIIQKKDQHYQEIIRYLLKDGCISEKRLGVLCDDLSQNFMKYAVYGNYDDLTIKKKSFWQASLFYEIFYEDKKVLPFRDLKGLKINKLENCHFHFFSLSHIPPLFFDFFNSFSNVYHYINSPCMSYWEDIASDFERHKIQKFWKKRNVDSTKIAELDSYLKERNSFLANMEKLKKNYLKTLSKYDDYQTFDNYVDYDDDREQNFLEIFKQDILHLENRNINNVKTIDKIDSSFQIHLTTSKFMEAKILLSNIVKLLDFDDKLKPSDIHIIAPNIDEYVPLIHMIFNSQDNFLDYKILNTSLNKQSCLIAGIVKIFSLINSKWSKLDVFDLLENEFILNRIKISKEEKDLLINYLEKSKIKWGLDKSHINQYLNVSQIHETEDLNSWEAGFSRILSGFTFMINQKNIDEGFSFCLPVPGQDSIDIDLFDKFLKFFSNLTETIKKIEKENFLSIKNWILFFNKILGFFDIKDNFIEKTAKDSCKNFLDQLKKLSEEYIDKQFSFEFIYKYFIKHISLQKINHNSNILQTLSFSSFDLSTVPAKAVFIIGLDDKSFNLDADSKLDLTNKNEAPSANDVFRSSFLQAMLSAEQYLYLSYASPSKNINESSIVMLDLFSYLDNSYILNGKKPSAALVVDHPSFPFHESYFNQEKSFSKSDFFAAKKYYGKDFKKIIGLQEPINIPDKIDIQSLRLLCKNPIKFYLNRRLEVYLEEKKTVDDFSLSFLDKYLIKKSFFQDEIDDIFFSYKNKGMMPTGVFCEIEKNSIYGEIKALNDSLLNLEIDKGQLVTIELSLTCQKETKISENYIRRPPIEINFENRQIKIFGKIENVSQKGLLFQGDDSKVNLVRNWIDILIFQAINGNFSKDLIFLKNEKTRSFKIESEKYLSNFMEYYLAALKEPSYMIKPFISFILKEDRASLEKELIKDLGEFSDEYSKWFFANYETLDADMIIKKQSSFVKTVFEPIVLEDI